MNWSLTKVSLNRKKRQVTEVWRGTAHDSAVHHIAQGMKAITAMQAMKAQE